MKHANYARTRATKAKGGQTTFLTRWGLTAPLEFHKPIKTLFKMKVHIFRRGVEPNLWLTNEYTDKDIKIVYCGYLELQNPLYPDNDLWNWCNWDCWSDEKPEECKHLNIGHCNSDVSYCIDGVFYSHGMHRFNDFRECYTEMCKEYSNYFESLFNYDYGFLDESQIKFVTPDNIQGFIE